MVTMRERFLNPMSSFEMPKNTSWAINRGGAT